jgi:hypothetical protein
LQIASGKQSYEWFYHYIFCFVKNDNRKHCHFKANKKVLDFLVECEGDLDIPTGRIEVGRSQEVQKKIKQAQLKMLESNKKIRDLAINIK